MKIIGIDSFVTIGHGHKICQDFALARDNMIIVCDGCSGAPDSELGAQLLARSLFKNIKENPWDLKGAIHSAIFTAQAAARVVGVDDTCLDATALVGVIQDDGFYYWIQGDGCVAYKYKDHLPVYTCLDYLSGAPEYFSYNLDHHRHNAYLEQLGNVRQWRIKNINKAGEYLDGSGYDQTEMTYLPTRELEWVAFFSDGVGSFTDLETFEVMEHLTAFKNISGKLVTRRAKKFFKEHPNRHEDDISMACIAFGE